MTSQYATNARDQLFGFNKPLYADYESNGLYPAELQIPLSSKTTTKTTSLLYTGADVPIENIWDCADVLGGGDVTYTFTQQQALNMVGRETRLALTGTYAAGNQLAIVLPAGWSWYYPGKTAAVTTMTLPANAQTTCTISWAAPNKVIVTGDVTGYTFT